jgi:hypothetical protein
MISLLTLVSLGYLLKAQNPIHTVMTAKNHALPKERGRA